MTRIFIRDDDVGVLTAELRTFFRTFAQRNIPVSYQIIPERLTPECANFIKEQRAREPRLVEFGQHGRRHEMWVRGKLEYYEFGPEKTYEEQSADIQAGRAILQDLLGEEAVSDIRVFTPPRHRYDRNTLKALKAAGFSILSASSYTSAKHRLAYGLARTLGMSNLGRPGVPWHGRTRPDSGLFELSIAVGVDNGSTITMTTGEVADAVLRSSRHTRDVGVLFHHSVFAGETGEVYLNDVADRLHRLPDVTFHTISELSPHRHSA